MRFIFGFVRKLFTVFVIVVLTLFLTRSVRAQQSAATTQPNPLVEILLAKGILTAEEVKSIEQAANTQQANERIATILLGKGVISGADYARITGQAAAAPPAKVVAVEPRALVEIAVAPATPPKPAGPSQAAGMSASANAQRLPNPTEPGDPSLVQQPIVKGLIPALAPIRALPVGAIRRTGMVPAFKADGVGITPYGFIKVTAAEDSSSPLGDDFPMPGFLCPTGPNGSPEFHIKARSSRIGADFAWYDPSAKWTISGKLEMDFEGNFNRSDNRNVSTIRSSNPSLRLAWGRLDYVANGKNTFSAVFGQDWTPFGSSTLPNILETTGLGIGFGSLYERSPQMRFGYTRTQKRIQIMPEFAVVLPAVGLTPSAAYVSQQLGYGERQGADSNRPDLEGRFVVQWQLDPARGVVPAQIIVSGEHGDRAATVVASAIPAAYQQTFFAGAMGRSHTDGWDFEWQLPTRYATLVGKFYSGADLRYFFVNQLYSYYNDTAGLTELADVLSVDGSSTVVLGTNAEGDQVVAPERAIRTEGGFAQLGFPLSRWFNAQPGGRNANWSVYATYGVDQAKTRDLNRLGASGNRRYSTMAIGTLNYGMNRWVSFSLEQSLYTTHANPEQRLPLFKGVPSREWNDIRTEFGPIFQF